MNDIIVVGAGTAGCVVARKLAEQGKQVLILEKKEHIGGNCYDALDENGVLIHIYGPHIFHTDDTRVFDYLSRFTEWHFFHHEVVANVHGQYVPVPFNLHTLKAVYGEERGSELEDKLVSIYGRDTKVPILELMNHEDADLQMIGKFVYDNIYVYYTMKQWGKKPEEIGDDDHLMNDLGCDSITYYGVLIKVCNVFGIEVEGPVEGTYYTLRDIVEGLTKDYEG